jgi:hypothetical protein
MVQMVNNRNVQVIAGTSELCIFAGTPLSLAADGYVQAAKAGQDVVAIAMENFFPQWCIIIEEEYDASP